MRISLELGQRCFVLAALGLLAGAVLHVAVLVGGADWIAFVGAPQAVVESARMGTLLAPVGALAIAVLLAGLAQLAHRASKLAKNFAYARSILWTFAVVFLARGLIALPVIVGKYEHWRHPRYLFFTAASGIVFLIGAALLIGLLAEKSEATLANNNSVEGV